MKNFMESNGLPNIVGLHFPKKMITLGGYDKKSASGAHFHTTLGSSTNSWQISIANLMLDKEVIADA